MSRLNVILTIAMMYASAAQAQEIVVPVAPVPTPADRTLPRSTFDCHLIHVSGDELLFKFEITGGRGYLKSGRVQRTETILQFTSDPSALFSQYTFFPLMNDQSFTGVDESGKGFFGELFQAQIEQADAHLDDDFSGRALLTISEARQPRMGMDPFYTATGFCDVVRTSQQPLSAHEISELEEQ